jgi:hypothetical protein
MGKAKPASALELPGAFWVCLSSRCPACSRVGSCERECAASSRVRWRRRWRLRESPPPRHRTPRMRKQAVATSCALVHGPMSPHGVPAFIAPVAGCVTPPMHDVSVGVVIAPSPTDKCLVLAGRGATSRCAQGAAGPSGARTYTRDVRERRPVTRASRPHHRVRSPVRRREASAGLDRQL